MAQLVWTQEAQRWLKDIFDYISVDSDAAAFEVIEGIYRRAQVLTDFPEIGARYTASARHVRVLLYGHYRIAYFVSDARDVEILGVFHGALDITRYQL
jgi:toxin ParE1/3/4